jgi:hypothetical protein
METFTKLIVNKMKDANMFAGQGGPIILAQVKQSRPIVKDIPKIWNDELSNSNVNTPAPPSQIENEYGNIQSGLPDQQSATKYIHWCAEMANNQNVGVPWIMCQQSNDLPPNVVRPPLQISHEQVMCSFE